MSIANARQLREALFPRPVGEFERNLNAAFDQIGFSEEYIASIANSDGLNRRRPKIVKDPVWGISELNWSTIRLLDCPLIQRLRGVHQLGFSYLTYPSAEHSRFAHSLGMTCVVNRFIAVMSSQKHPVPPEGGFSWYQLSEYQQDPNDRNLAESLRHAALLHDLGHLPFSHALEFVFHANASTFTCGGKTVDDFLFLFEDILEKDNPKLAESLSIAVVLSPRFREFYNKCVFPDFVTDPDRLERMACLIAGKPHDPAFPGLAKIISDSSVDADKVDYVCRDGASCGIPIGVDVARLFLRSSFISARRAKLLELNPRYRGPDEAVLFVVNASGIDTLEEITQARTSLFQRVYLHKTTRSVERLFAKCVELRTAELGKPPDALSDWASDDFSYLRELSEGLGPSNKLASRIRNRRLPKRALAFGRDAAEVALRPSDFLRNVHAKADSAITRKVVGAQLMRLRSSILRGVPLAELEEKIATEATRLRDLLRSDGMQNLPTDGPPLVCVLPIPKIDEERQDEIILQNYDLLRTPDLSSSDEVSDSVETFKALGFVMSDEPWRPLVLIAARRVLYEASDLRPDDADIEFSKGPARAQIKVISRLVIDLTRSIRHSAVSGQVLEEALTIAEAAGYFDDAPLLARSPKTWELEDQTSLFRDFNGQSGWLVTSRSLVAFIRQFPPALRTEATKMVESFQFIDRAKIATAVGELVTARGNNIKIAGFSPDSGSYVRMLAEHELSERFKKLGAVFLKSASDMFEALSADSDAVALMIDDNSVSGSQACAQLLAWMGKPRTEWPEDMRAERGIVDRALSLRDQEVLRNANLQLGFIVGSDLARSRVEQTAKDLSINRLTFAFHEKIGDVAFSPTPAMSRFLEQIGTGVLAYCRGSNNAKGAELEMILKLAKKDSLGYSGAGCLLATALNVPTSTFTAFWCPGIVNGKPWWPLLLRRGYLNNLVLG